MIERTMSTTTYMPYFVFRSAWRQLCLSEPPPESAVRCTFDRDTNILSLLIYRRGVMRTIQLPQKITERRNENPEWFDKAINRLVLQQMRKCIRAIYEGLSEHWINSDWWHNTIDVSYAMVQRGGVEMKGF